MLDLLHLTAAILTRVLTRLAESMCSFQYIKLSFIIWNKNNGSLREETMHSMFKRTVAALAASVALAAPAAAELTG
ncbi:MAG: hypothetical protein AAF625_08345, partial [Pseudomonadota bacterium]